MNTPPYLVDFDKYEIYEVKQGEELVVKLDKQEDPDIRDSINLEVVITESDQQWIEFDPKER